MTTTTEPTTPAAPARPRPWTLAITREDLACRIQHQRAPDIARALGVCDTTVRQHLMAFGIPSPWGRGRPKGPGPRSHDLPPEQAPHVEPPTTPTRPAKLTLTDEEIVARTQAGETQEAIGASFGVTRQRVCQRLRASGLEYARNYATKRQAPLTAEALAALVADKTIAEAAREAGVHVQTMTSWLASSGIKPGRTGPRRVGDVSDEEVVRRLAAGETQAEVAASIGIRTSSLMTRIRRSGLEYVRHKPTGAEPVRGSKAWRCRRYSVAAVRVAEYARITRAEHDTERAEVVRLQAAIVEARRALVEGRTLDAYAALTDAAPPGGARGAPTEGDPTPEILRAR